MNGRIGEEFARAVAGKDRGALLALLEPRIDFRALTPGRPWEATESVEVVDGIILGHWFGPDDRVEALVQVTTGAMADREHLAYRLRVRTGDVLYLVEQQVYYAVDRGRIPWLRVMCSGFRPLCGGGADAPTAPPAEPMPWAGN